MDRPRISPLPSRSSPIIPRPSNFRSARGADFEARTAQRLVADGLALVERNFRCRVGEIDLVARDGATLVFVEVRARLGGLERAEESLGPAKRRRLRKAIEYYLWSRAMPGDLRGIRVDLAAWNGGGGGAEAAVLTWYRGIAL